MVRTIPIELLGSIIASTIAACASIVVAFISAKSAREAARTVDMAKESRERENQRRTEQRMMDDATYAVLLATANSVELLLRHAKGEKLNGNVEAASNELAAAKHSYSRTRDKLASNLLNQ